MQPSTEPDFLKLVGQFVESRVQLAVKSATEPLLAHIAGLEEKITKLESGWSTDMEDVRLSLQTIDGRIVSKEQVQSLIMQRIKEDLELGALADHDDVVGHCMHLFRDRLIELGLVTGGENGMPLSPVLPKDGKDGTSITAEDVLPELKTECLGFMARAVAGYFQDNPIQHGKDGVDGKDGQDGKSVSVDDVLAGVRGLVAEAVDALPVPRGVVGAVIDRDGDLCLVLSDGESKKLGKVVGNDGLPGKDGKDGRPGENGKDGKDGIGFKDMSVTFDGERDFAFKFVLEDRVEELKMTIPFVLYRGVWRPGNYKQGDQVTRDGSQFVAMRDTDGQPGTAESGWQLSTKRGRDGKDGDAGPPGPPGPPGKNGRDLTQIGPDGKKWG
jgi:hypothetical protein